MVHQPYSKTVKSDRRSAFLFFSEVSVPLQGEEGLGEKGGALLAGETER